jgi:hypothetical protein
MLAALDGAVGNKNFTFCFQLSLALVSLSAWYWARTVLNARFDVADDLASRHALARLDERINAFAFDTVPRLLFVLAVAIGFGLILRSPHHWIQLVYLALWSVPAGLFLVFRLKFFAGKAPDDQGRPPTCPTPDAPSPSLLPGQHALRSTAPQLWVSQLPARLDLLVRRAPYGPWLSSILIAVSVSAFVWGAVESFVAWPKAHAGPPALVAAVFPAATAALVVLALIIAPLSALTFMFDGLRINIRLCEQPVGIKRPPVITVLLLWIVIPSMLLSLHTVRTVGGSSVTMRLDLSEFFADWVAHCVPREGTVRPVIVAISGGASRAGIWGARVLLEVERAVEPSEPATFAVSSVSGGSLGAAAYMSLLAAMDAENRCAKSGSAVRRKQINAIDTRALAQDALGPLLAGALIVDIPRSIFAPFAAPVRWLAHQQPRGGDRAEALERAFEGLWRMSANGVQKTDFADPFLSLFYENGQLRHGMPIWIGNGTDLRTGVRLLTVPFKPPHSKAPSDPNASDHPWPFLTAVDLLSQLNADVPISTAINNTARFPYLEPSGELLGPSTTQHGSEVIDGGYFENEGLQTALELADWLSQQTPHGRSVRPVIVQATGDGSAHVDKSDVIRCDSPTDDPSKISTAALPSQLLAPLLGLYNVRGGHSAVALGEARKRYCPDRAFFHFYLPGLPDGTDVPLNWILSNDTAEFIWNKAMEVPDSGNQRESQNLSTKLSEW